MSNELGAFEESVKQSMEHFELPYAPSAWNDLERKLDQRSSGSHWWVAALAAALVTSAGVWAIYQSNFNITKAKAATASGRFAERYGYSSMTIQTGRASEFNSAEELSNSAGQASAQSENNAANTSASNSSLEKNNSSTSSSSIAANSGTVSEGASTIIDSSVATVDSGNWGVNDQNVSSTSAPANRELGIMANVSNACAGSEIEFAATNGPKEGSFLWNFGDASFSNSPNPKHKFSKPGVYNVSLSVTNNDGKVTTKILNDFITINDAPKAKLNVAFLNPAGDEATVKFMNLSEDATSYNWKFGDGTASSEVSPVRTFDGNGKHPVVLEVTNQHGCYDSDLKYITLVKDFNLNAPQKVSIGSEFMPEALKQGKLKFVLRVFNGEKLIFETNSKTKGWDGKFLDGGSAAAGQQFTWMAVVSNDSSNEEKYYSGVVTFIP
jgi:hypothetical protein